MACASPEDEAVLSMKPLAAFASKNSVFLCRQEAAQSLADLGWTSTTRIATLSIRSSLFSRELLADPAANRLQAGGHLQRAYRSINTCSLPPWPPVPRSQWSRAIRAAPAWSLCHSVMSAGSQ